MSETPWTDALPTVYKYRSTYSGLVYDNPAAAGTCEALEYIPKDEARQLERELAAVTKERDALRAGLLAVVHEGVVERAEWAQAILDAAMKGEG